MSSFSEKELEKQLKIHIPDRYPDPAFLQELETKLGIKARKMEKQRRRIRQSSIISGFITFVLLVIWVISPNGHQWVKNNILSNANHNQTVQKDQEFAGNHTKGELNEENLINGVSANDSQPEYKTIQEKMQNAIDNYENIKGKFHIIHKQLDLDNIIEFEVSEGDNPGSYIIVKGTDDKILTEYRSDGESFLFMDVVEKKYQWEAVSSPSQIPEGPRHFIDKEGQHNWITRPDPAWAYSAHDVIFPQNYAFWLTDQKNYQIIGHERYLGRDTTLIEGNNEPYMAKKLEAPYFKMWVDTETGVLLKLLTINENKQITNRIEVLSLAIDQGVDISKFSTKVPVGWKVMTSPGSLENNGEVLRKQPQE